MNPNTRFKWLFAGLTATMFALLGWPAVGSAAETFGSRLLNAPNYGGCADVTAPCTYAAYIHPSDPLGDPYSGGAPRDGVIVKFRIRAIGPGGPGTPASVTFGLADVNRTDPNNATATAAGFGPTVTLAGSGEIEEFAAQLPVKKGNQVAIRTSDARAIYSSNSDKFTYVFSPPLADNEPPKASSQVTQELLVAAVIEPDADRDGFGDETQDNCLGKAGSDGGCPTPDEIDKQTKPKVSGLSIAPKVGKGARTVTYRLSKAGKVVMRVQRLSKGRRVAGKCRKVNRRNRSRKACTRVTKVPGRITKTGRVGLNRANLPARINGRKLVPGRYRLVVKLRDGQGRVSPPAKVGFRVVRR